ncbi:MAG: hypothetical protein HYY64_10150 [Candidatus Rokubacteria bacterium]|nr:hypothetical protein [Candidatus Rokubacteria bacterium]
MRAPTALLALLAVLVFAPRSQAEDARLAVEQFVARLAEISVTDMVVTQTLTLYDPKDPRQQVRGDRKLWIKVPARLREETKVEDLRLLRVMNGDRLVVERGGKVFEAPPRQRERQRVHTLFPLPRTAADLLREWASLGIRTEVVTAVRVGGRTITLIGAVEGDRTSPAVWFDSEYGVVRIITRVEGPDGVKMGDVAFSEHRKVSAGFFYPFRQELFLDGKLLEVASVRSVEVNTGLPESLFDPDALLEKGGSR